MIDKTIKDRVNKIIMFTSNDEEDNGKESLKIYNRALGGKIIELKKEKSERDTSWINC